MAEARSFAVTILSNGTLLTEEACDRLASFPNLWGVSLSLYGASEKTYAAVTRSRGSFERTIAGARRLRERGIRTWLKIILLQANAAETGAMLELADREGFEHTVDTTITGRYDGTRGSLSDRVDLKTLEALYRGPLNDLLGKGKEDPDDDEFKCNCARGNGAVSATGEVYPCIATPLRAGNIRERSFLEIWNESPVFKWIRGLKISDFKTCAPCPLKAWCRRSTGAAYLHSGDFTGVDPLTCEEAALIRSLSPAP
jgi:radical SAM protein with 4Fe4S-binding SPASM domain